MLARYTSEGQHIWGVFSEGELIGAAGLARHYDASIGGVGLLWGIYVLPRYRGTPVSRRMMDAIIDFCTVDTTIYQLIAPCSRWNRAGRLFLQRFRFESTQGHPLGLAETKANDIVYLRRVI